MNMKMRTVHRLLLRLRTGDKLYLVVFGYGELVNRPLAVKVPIGTMRLS